MALHYRVKLKQPDFAGSALICLVFCLLLSKYIFLTGTVLIGPTDPFFHVGFIEYIYENGRLFGELPAHLQLLGPETYIYPPLSHIVTGALALVAGINEPAVFKFLFILNCLFAVFPLSVVFNKVSGSKILGPLISLFVLGNVFVSTSTIHTGQWARIFAYLPIACAIYFFLKSSEEPKKPYAYFLTIALLLSLFTSVYPFLSIAALIFLAFLTKALLEKKKEALFSALKTFWIFLLVLPLYVISSLGKSGHLKFEILESNCSNGLLSFYCNEANVESYLGYSIFVLALCIFFSVLIFLNYKKKQNFSIFLALISSGYILLHLPFIGIGGGTIILSQFQLLAVSIGIIFALGFSYIKFKHSYLALALLIFYLFLPINSDAKDLQSRFLLDMFSYPFRELENRDDIKQKNELLMELRSKEYLDGLVLINENEKLEFGIAGKTYTDEEISFYTHKKIFLRPLNDETLKENSAFLSFANHSVFENSPETFKEDFRSSDEAGYFRVYIRF
jgi:hypothetical protein